jgi:hypothetical protein
MEKLIVRKGNVEWKLEHHGDYSLTCLTIYGDYHLGGRFTIHAHSMGSSAQWRIETKTKELEDAIRVVLPIHFNELWEKYLYQYSRKKGLSEGSDGVQQNTFIAQTWIPVVDMLDFQYNAWEAYRDGDSELAISIMSANKNTNQTDEYLDWIVSE